MIDKKQLGTFSSISIFSEKYIKVERKGLYNLIDNDGKYVSDTWFEEITKSGGDGADFVEAGSHKKTQLSSVSLIGRYNTVNSLIASNDVLSFVDMKCVMVVTPRKMSVRTGGMVTVVAEVTLMGEVLLMAEDGNLYRKDGTRYIVPNFFISMTDINRLESLANKTNMVLKSDYNVNDKKEQSTPLWIFGFNAEEMIFNTIQARLIDHSDVKAWGGDTIKVRFNINRVPDTMKDALKCYLQGLGYNSAIHDFYSESCVWMTKKYGKDDMSKIFDEIGNLESVVRS